MKRKSHPCPICKTLTSKVKDTFCRKINHGLFINRKCTVYFNRKRYVCPICQKIFNESNPLVQKHQKKSLASFMILFNLLKNPHITFKKAAELCHLSVTTVINTFVESCPDFKQPLPRVLCIDEVYLGRKASKKYVAVLLDFETQKVVDIIYGRNKDSLHSYFQTIPLKERQKVEFISSDLYDGFLFLHLTYLKNAKLCADSFHVIQLILNMFEKEILKTMNQFQRDSLEYYLLKNKRELLLKNSYRIDWSHREYNHKIGYTISYYKLREMMVEIHPIRNEMYDLKEEYLQINGAQNMAIAKERLEPFISVCLHATHPEIRRIGRTLSKWKHEIIHSLLSSKEERFLTDLLSLEIT